MNWRVLFYFFCSLLVVNKAAFAKDDKDKPNWKSFGLTLAGSKLETNPSQIDFPDQIYGFRYAHLNQKKYGLYFGGQLNRSVVKESEYQFNDVTQVHNFDKDLVFISNSIEKGFANIDLGITKKFLPATWIYFGPGFCYNRSFHDVSLFEEDGKFINTIEAENINPENRFTPSAEAGLVVNFRIFNVGLGVKSYNVLAFDFEESFYNATVGIILKRKKHE
mgnify:CR=1 FL=1